MNIIGSIKNKMTNAGRDLYTKVVSAPTESKFFEKGVLTPKEFVLAGDQLVTMCPSWEWKPASNDKYMKSELPRDKQYLYSKVPCPRRIKDIFQGQPTEKDSGDGWMVADGVGDQENGKKTQVVKVDVDDIEKEMAQGQGNDEYEEEEMDGIKIRVLKKKPAESDEKSTEHIEVVVYPLFAIEKPQEENKEDFETIMASESQMRYYELSITYDFYYNTPKLWLSGYTEDNLPLNETDMFEDIMDEYAKKTVTYETHPHLGLKQLSIHPCKHSEVMKQLLDVARENNSNIEVHHALFVFLKFISSVVPTMEYDFTVDIELGA